jgi:hypothetical protein
MSNRLGEFRLQTKVAIKKFTVMIAVKQFQNVFIQVVPLTADAVIVRTNSSVCMCMGGGRILSHASNIGYYIQSKSRMTHE